MDKPAQQDRHYAFFANTACEYSPCHAVEPGEPFNCLFCYCPLYLLGSRCGGNFVMHAGGVKDCSGCLLPHRPGGYDVIRGKYTQILEELRRKEKEYGKSD